MALTVNYNLGNHGWAELHMSLGRERVSMTVSYLHDTLAELITAANLLLKGAPDAKVIAMDEPGEHLIHLQSNDALHLSIEVRWFKDWASWNMITETLYSTVGGWDVLAQLIKATAELDVSVRELAWNFLQKWREKALRLFTRPPKEAIDRAKTYYASINHELGQIGRSKQKLWDEIKYYLRYD